MKALVGAFNQEKALVGAFSVIVQPVVEPMDQFAALVSAVDNSQQLENKTAEEDFWLSHGTAPSSRRQSQQCGWWWCGVARRCSLLSQSRRKILIVGLAGSSRQQQAAALGSDKMGQRSDQ